MTTSSWIWINTDFRQTELKGDNIIFPVCKQSHSQYLNSDIQTSYQTFHFL